MAGTHYLIGSEQQIQLPGLGVHWQTTDKQGSDLKQNICMSNFSVINQRNNTKSSLLSTTSALTIFKSGSLNLILLATNKLMTNILTLSTLSLLSPGKFDAGAKSVTQG